MNRDDLVTSFQDTIAFVESPALKAETDRAEASSRIYPENFQAQKHPGGYSGTIIVENDTTFSAAKKHLADRTAVLNFANPVVPGGGVRKGAMAQEECLCRSSNLYACLTSSRISDYYIYNASLNHYFFSDWLIYTKGVTVFKNDEDIPRMMPQQDWFQVDVITCAAPYIEKRKYTNRTALKALFKKRIKNIFEAAIENGVTVLILGAFGCGAFKNPPSIVAAAFHEVIVENCYHVRAVTLPSGCILKNAKQVESYYAWQRGNKYFGKQFSILGDSISTLDGYNPRGYKLFYTGEICDKSDIHEMIDTWWGKVIDYFGGELLVNNSWSGSRVTKLPDQDTLFPSGCSDERTGCLHINDIIPDVIIIYLGFNDWGYGAKVEGTEDESCFAAAYLKMLESLKRNYPNAEIFCCTLCETYMSSNPSFKFPYAYSGTHIEHYNSVIRSLAEQTNCFLLDLYNAHVPYDAIDGAHPTAEGMNILATLMLRGMCDDEGVGFLNCESEHDFVSVEEYTGGSKDVCRKCGYEKKNKN